jgi:protein-L-isoaspartate O-methyltransferase
MTPDQIIAAGVRNWNARQAQIARLRPRADEARQKRAEMMERATSCKAQNERAAAFEKLITIPNFYPTPPRLVEKVIELAGIRPGMRVLEPSCGKGDFAHALRRAGAVLECVELVRVLADICEKDGLPVQCRDFLAMEPSDYAQPFDRVIMNPPFENGACRLHALHAFKFLRPGGELVAIVGNVTAHRLNTWADYVEHLPPGSFECSERPTSVNTAIVQKTK